jgi:hypothetical protein
MYLQWFATMSTTAVKKIATAVQKPKCSYAFWFNKTKYVKQVQLSYRTEFVMDPPYKSFICAFYKKLCEAGYFLKWEVSFVDKFMDGSIIPIWYIYRVTKSAYV